MAHKRAFHEIHADEEIENVDDADDDETKVEEVEATSDISEFTGNIFDRIAR